MSYTPKPAGHEEAPVERDVRVESDVHIETIISRTASAIRRRGESRVISFWASIARTSVADLRRHQHPPLTQDSVERVLYDPRFIDLVRQTTSPPVSHYLAKSQLLARVSDVVVLQHATKSPFPFFDVECARYHMGDQSRRVFVVNGCTHTHLDDGLGTKRAMVLYRVPLKKLDNDMCESTLITQQPIDDICLGGSFVIIDTAGTNGEKISFPIVEDLEGSRITYIDTTRQCRGYQMTAVSRLSQFVQDFPCIPKLQQYVDTLVERSQDPHSLHLHYGKTPGPRVYRRITNILEKYFFEQNYPRSVRRLLK